MTDDTPPRNRAGDRRGKRRPGGPVVLSRIPVTILGNPFQFAVALASIGLAVGVLVLALTAGVASLPLWVVAVWTGGFLSGGFATIIGMFRRDAGNGRTGVAAESVGLVLLGTGWTVYVLGVVFGSGMLGPIFAGVAIILACIFRIYAIIIAGRVVRSTAAIRAETR